jgi:hypothetical protein
MIKTVYTIRIKTLATLREENEEKTFTMVVTERVLNFCKQYQLLEMRARINMEEGPYVVNSDEPVSDEVLLSLKHTKEK